MRHRQVKFVEVGKSGTGFRLSGKPRSLVENCDLKKLSLMMMSPTQ